MRQFRWWPSGRVAAPGGVNPELTIEKKTGSGSEPQEKPGSDGQEKPGMIPTLENSINSRFKSQYDCYISTLF